MYSQYFLDILKANLMQNKRNVNMDPRSHNEQKITTNHHLQKYFKKDTLKWLRIALIEQASFSKTSESIAGMPGL